jgi:LCP family protein required for cell wall assembly
LPVKNYFKPRSLSFFLISVLLIFILMFSLALSSCSTQSADNNDENQQAAESTAQGQSQASDETTSTAAEAEITAAGTSTEPPPNYYVSSSKDFDNYSFVCPEGWKLYETKSGAGVMLQNDINVESKNESIFISVDNISGLDQLQSETGIIDTYTGSAKNDKTVKLNDEETVSIGSETAKLSGYSYKSSLDSQENSTENESPDSINIDLFTYIKKGDVLYSIKYIGKNVEETGAKETFKKFLADFSLNEKVQQQKQKDENNSVNILILGDDSGMGRAGGRVGGRTDIIIILHLNLDTCKGTAVTIPRDTWVDIPGHGEGKINGAHAFGGNELTVQTIENLTGLKIDNYIITDMDGFGPLIDFLGGVTVEVGENLSDGFSGCYLSKGVHHLDGTAAQALARNRHRAGDGSTQGGAFAREREAAKIIVALLDQKSTFERIVAMPVFVNFLLKYTWTDLKLLDVLRLLPVLGKIKSADIELAGLPSWPQAVGNASAVVYDVEAAAELFEEIKNQ